MSEHICRNCRWWTPPFEGFFPGNPWGECLKSLEDDALLNTDYEHSPVKSKADFGCVQWECKE